MCVGVGGMGMCVHDVMCMCVHGVSVVCRLNEPSSLLKYLTTSYELSNYINHGHCALLYVVCTKKKKARTKTENKTPIVFTLVDYQRECRA